MKVGFRATNQKLEFRWTAPYFVDCRSSGEMDATWDRWRQKNRLPKYSELTCSRVQRTIG